MEVTSDSLRILIIGFGNAGSGMAADLALKGHRVGVLKTSRAVHGDHFEVVARSGEVVLREGGVERVARLEGVTRDVREAFGWNPEVVVVATQSLQHARVFDLIRGHLGPGNLVLLEPGNCGSLLLARGAGAEEVRIAEATSTPVDVRVTEPGRVDVLFRNVRNPLGFFPGRQGGEMLRVLRRLYPNFYGIGTTLVAALHNPNLIVHTVGALLSVPRIEHSQGEFWMYREGFTPSVWNVIKALDGEKMAVLKALGAEEIPYLEMAKVRNAEDLSIDARAMFQRYCETGSPKGPASIETRYIHEDVPKGLVLLESMGRLVGERTPTATMLINLAAAYTRKDFRAGGSTLENLGIAGWSREAVLHWLETGECPA